MFNADVLALLGNGLVETLVMTFAVTFLSYLIGLPLGVFLITSAKNGLRPHPSLNRLTGTVINLMRSVPFLIMIMLVSPLSKILLGSTIGIKAAILGLTFSAAPFVARVVEQSLLEVDQGVIEAAQSMGASPRQIVWRVYLVEAYPSLINGVLLSLTTILAYSTMAGMVGAGGLGDIAIRFGYYRYDMPTMIVTVGIIVILVQIIQMLGERYANLSDKRIKE